MKENKKYIKFGETRTKWTKIKKGIFLSFVIIINFNVEKKLTS